MATKGDGSVSISVNMDIDDAEKELNRLKQKVFKLEEDLTVGKSKKGALAAELEQAKKALADLQSQTQIKDGRAIITPENVTKISAMQEKIAQLTAEIEKQNSSLRNTQMELDGVKTRYGEVAQTSMGGSSGKMQTILSGLATGFKGIMQYSLKAGASIAKSFGSAALNGVKKLGNLVVKAGKGFLSLFKSAKSANSIFGGGLKNMLLYSVGLRGLYSVFGKLRTALSDGFKNLAQFSASTNKSLSTLKSSLTQLKNALATAFAPILQTIEPIITRFINMLIRAADYVARLTAALTGKTSYTRATKVQEQYAKSIEGTGSAAEDASKSMAKFDEINQITTKDASGGGGGGSSETSPADMFETVQIEPLTFDSWGEAFSAMLDKILVDGIPKLKEAFSSFAEWLNGFSAKLYEAFTFPGIYEKVSRLGAEIATAFNDLANQVDWATIGAALGAGLSLAITFLVNLIYTFDWSGLGAKLATMLNNAIAQIDWRNVGALLWSKFKIALDMLLGFILNLDTAQIAAALSDTIKGFFDSITEWIYSYNWKEVGSTVYQKIKDFITGIDYAGISDALCEGIGAALGGLAAFVWGVIEDAWNDVVDWWHDVAYEDGQFTIEGLLNGIWEGIKDIGKWIKEHILQPFIDGFKKAFGIASPSKVMEEQGGFVIDGLLNGVKKGIQPIVDLFENLKKTVKKVLGGISDFISGVFTGDWEKAWNGVKDIFAGVWNGIVDIVESAINFVIDGINLLISALNRIQVNIPDWVPLLGGKSFGINIPPVTRVSLPRLASGAVIPPNSEFLAVLGDQKSGTNIETPLATMVQAFKQAMAEAGGMGGRNITVVMQVDKREFARAVYTANNDETQRVGVRLAGVRT